MRRNLLCLLMLLPVISFAQDISGRWVGNYGFSILSTQPRQVVLELQIYNDSLVTGTTHLYHRRDDFEHYRISGVYHKKDSTIYFEEDSIIGRKASFGVTYVMCNYTMRLRTLDSVMRFEGKLRENGAEFVLLATKVWFEKPLDRKPMPKPKDKNLNRGINVQSLIELNESEKDSIKIELWDNAQIDGDIVSLYLNDSTVLSKYKLTAEHAVFYISVSRSNPICRLSLAAESQGSVPPCTAHMTVTTAQKNYELDLSSDYNRSGTIEFFLKE